MFICHGAGEHCRRYSKLVSRLNACNVLVFAHDHGEYMGILRKLGNILVPIRGRPKSKLSSFVL